MTKFLIGTSGWTYENWQGKFYPQDLPKSRWFDYYVTKFRAVEINATFYRRFASQTYKKWYSIAPPKFKYVIKAHRFITHRKYLNQVARELKNCEAEASILKEKLGLILLQLPPNMPYKLDRLQKALMTFKDCSKVAVEFRNHKWLTPSTKALLTEYGAVFCTSDAPGINLLDWVTAHKAYIRLHGRDLSYSTCYTKRELQNIASLAKRMAHNGVQEIYIFFNNDACGYAPQNAMELQQILYK